MNIRLHESLVNNILFLFLLFLPILKGKGSRSVVSDSLRFHGLQPIRLLRPWGFPGKSTGVGCHCLLPFWTQLQTVKKKKKWVQVFLSLPYTHALLQCDTADFPIRKWSLFPPSLTLDWPCDFHFQTERIRGIAWPFQAQASSSLKYLFSWEFAEPPCE